jgi:hemolysin III
LHLGTLPFALVAGLFLTARGRSLPDRESIAIFTATACLLFGTSAAYHRGSWSDKTVAFLRRMDLGSIALVIAGTYTPIAIAILTHAEATVLLTFVWSAALVIAGISIGWRHSKINVPRWLFTSIFVILGWASILWFPELLPRGGVINFSLIAIGGLLYTGGAVVYARKRPALSPETFGYHELFHACTVAAFMCHLVVVARVAA